MKIFHRHFLLTDTKCAVQFKVHIIFGIVLFFALVQPGFSQSPVTGVTYADSLKNVLTRLPADTSRINTLFVLSDYYSDKDTALALNYVNQAAGYSGRNSYYAALVHFYRAGVFLIRISPKVKTVISQLKNCLEIFPGNRY